ncbi:DUF1559 domain-containing protein [Allorhodopirellula heiligendammensis]|uniref:DUF1559 domain-containing protein n=1 Tax=Allorhodopirellula heiligendammensis TaxID=2714739 RepID=A0A5C6C813_9BACT|nr:DUF1559 domain-containing protein [Allorhodopirellula heiligendammensis]TWU19454.1 hypothetical protein Poly21_16270 [Allorhodopirellula heiligendammensis]
MAQLDAFQRPIRIRRVHSGFTIFELLVAVAIIGILAALLLPAIGAARESARRIQCVSHLREVGLALHNHHHAMQRLPTGWRFDPSNRSATGWAVALLPYLGQTALADRVDVNKTVDDPVHAMARETTLDVLLCPSDIAEPNFRLFAESEFGGDEGLADRWSGAEPEMLVQLPTANYVGMFGTIEADDSIPAPLGDGSFLENRSTQFRDFQRGLSNTIVVGERTMKQVPSTWLGVSLRGEDAAARLVGSALEGINNPLADEADFSSRHPDGANFLWGDGHVSFVTRHVDLDQYHRWARIRLDPNNR